MTLGQGSHAAAHLAAGVAFSALALAALAAVQGCRCRETNRAAVTARATPKQSSERRR